MTTNQDVRAISGVDERRHFAWLDDSVLPYDTPEETNSAFSHPSHESSDVRPTDSRGHGLDEIFNEVLGYEGTPVGIDNHGNFVGFDGIEFTVYNSSEGFKADERVERTWGESNPVETYVFEDAESRGPWIVTQDRYEGFVDQSGTDLSEATIIDQHAAQRWNERGDSLNYGTIADELDDASVQPVSEELRDDLSFDYVREGEQIGTIFLQKANRVVTTLESVDNIKYDRRRRALRQVLK